MKILIMMTLLFQSFLVIAQETDLTKVSDLRCTSEESPHSVVHFEIRIRNGKKVVDAVYFGGTVQDIRFVRRNMEIKYIDTERLRLEGLLDESRAASSYNVSLYSFDEIEGHLLFSQVGATTRDSITPDIKIRISDLKCRSI